MVLRRLVELLNKSGEFVFKLLSGASARPRKAEPSWSGAQTLGENGELRSAGWAFSSLTVVGAEETGILACRFGKMLTGLGLRIQIKTHEGFHSLCLQSRER